jgi:Fe2+ or Zn2+ uptake regulation protein
LSRSAVLEVLAAQPRQYLDADAVFQKLLHQGRSLSLGTVYRVLKKLAEDGVILGEWAPTLAGSGKRMYRLKPPDYEERGTRLVCRQCRRSVLLADEGLREYLIRVADRHGLRVTDQPMTVQVVCFSSASCHFKHDSAPEIPAEALS